MARGWERPPAWAWVGMAVGVVAVVVMAYFAANRPAPPDFTAVPAADEPQAEAPAGPPLNLEAVHRVLFIGDSWTNGTAATPVTRGFAYVLAGSMGWEAQVHGYGSVGYVTPGVDRGGNFQQRWEREPDEPAPDLVVLQGSQNDLGRDLNELRAAAGGLVDAVRARLPGVQLVMVGPAPATSGLATSLGPVAGTLSQVAADKAVPFIDPLQARWLTAGNMQQYVTATDPHLNTEGHAYFAQRLGEALRTLGT